MDVKQCMDCGAESRPRRRHPSSLRAEVTAWLVAMVIGGGIGMWNAVTSGSGPATDELQVVAMSAIRGNANAVEAEPAGARGVWEAVVNLGAWLGDRLVDVLRAAWWVLLFPMMFSLWRQFGTREVCPGCGSAHLSTSINRVG